MLGVVKSESLPAADLGPQLKVLASGRALERLRHGGTSIIAISRFQGAILRVHVNFLEYNI